MQIKSVGEILASAGLGPPQINALVPNESNYSVLLMQPHGEVEASAAGVWNRDRDLARRTFGQFLADAHQAAADLVITPEYAMPWETMVTAIKGGTTPAPGKLWALGCESIKYGDLETVKQDLSRFAMVLYEPLPPDASRFVDPLAYVFIAPPLDGTGVAKIVILVQFKTYPMGDNDHFEINGLQKGTLVYQFGEIGQSIRLVSLICSDAFAFTDAHASAIYDRVLVVHIQLNARPRQEQYRQYRDRLLFYQGDATELICLNWARDVNEWSGGTTKCWNNIAGSAWYLRPAQFDWRDATLCANHRRGLYYTWCKPLRAHALFFNYAPSTYLLEATKVAHVAVPASISRRRGPQLTKTCIWNDATTTWVEQVVADDGFSGVATEGGNAKDEIKRIADSNPFEAERVLALCAGNIEGGNDWHDVRQLDSCKISASEIICRITFCQDTDSEAAAFRVERLKLCGTLWDILTAEGPLPSSLSDFKAGFRLEWSPNSPHQNAVSLSAPAQRATVIYMGEGCSNTRIEKTKMTIADYLRRASSSDDHNVTAKQRLAVWFRDGGKVKLFEPHRYVQIDQTNTASEFDIGRE